MANENLFPVVYDIVRSLGFRLVKDNGLFTLLYPDGRIYATCLDTDRLSVEILILLVRQVGPL